MAAEPRPPAAVAARPASARGTSPEGHTGQLLEGETTARLNCLKFDAFGNAKYGDKEFGFCSSST